LIENPHQPVGIEVVVGWGDAWQPGLLARGEIQFVEVVSTHPIEVSTLFIALLALGVSIWAVWVNRKQAAAARDQADEAKRSREIAHEALRIQAAALKSQGEQATDVMRMAERSATAAEQSAVASRTIAMSALETQRADLTVRAVDDIGRPVGGRVPTGARAHLFNSGKVTAMDVHVHQRMEILGSIPGSLPIPESWITLQPTNIGAGLEYFVFTEYEGPPMAGLLEGTKFLCVYGMAKYRDFIGERTRGWCYAWDLAQQIWYPAGPLNTVS
jgi:hypothetical protein